MPKRDRERQRGVFAAVAVAVFGIGVFIVYDLRRTGREAEHMYTELVRGLDVIGELQYETQEARRSMLYALATTDSNRQVEYADQSRAAESRVSRLLARSDAVARPEEDAARERLARHWQAYTKVRDEVIASILEGDVKGAVERDLRLGVPAFDRVREDLHALNQLFKDGAVARLEEVKASSTRSLVKLVVLLGLAQLLAVVSIQALHRSRMLDAVARSEARLVDVIESINEAMFVVDRDGTLRIWNEAAERVFGRPRREVLGRALAEAVPELTSSTLPAALGEALVHGKAVALPELFIGESHGAQVFEGRVFPFESGATVFLDDVSERRRAEEALRKNEALLKLVLDTLPVGVWVADREGRIVLGNPAGDRIWRVAKDVPLEENAQIQGFWAEDGHPLPTNELGLALALTGETCLNQTIGIADSGGRRKTLLHSAVPARGADGRIVGAVIVNEDISARRQLEDQLRQAQKMEAVGRLAGGIAHDFNNLLTTMLGYASLVLSQLEDDSPHRASVAEIRAAAERAAGLTQQLLAFSRKQVLEPRVVSLNALISDAANMLRRLIGEKVELVTRLDPALASVRADPGQLEQVIVNLAINARDAMPDGGSLAIETRAARPEDAVGAEVPAHRCVLLTVSDTGAGMDADVQTHIFEPFFTTKEKGKGTGLGLATVYGIVKQSGGTIALKSERGKGSTFRIFLPEAGDPEEAPSRTGTGPGTLRGLETILLTEDEESVRALIRGILGSAGYTVLEAKTGTEALAIATRHPGSIHLLVTDVVMPGMNGPELVQLLAHVRPDMKVLYMSGYTDEAIGPLGVLDGGAPFLAKPFTAERFSKKVREVLAGREEIPSG
jgi:two-component system cell cycle sensor histidine kinase/response regulator CckA